MNRPSFQDSLASSDPFSDQTLEALLSFFEETLYVDYKETFDPQSEEQWLGLTKDVMAFANAFGGYVVFGVEDGSYELIGIGEELARKLSNVDELHQKLNRYLKPDLTSLRAKNWQYKGKWFAAILIPESKGRTHIVVKEGWFKYAGGKERQIVLRPGMVYVRRSGSNHVIDPSDLEVIIDRRIDYFRDSLLSKIARVVQAPPGNEVLVYDPSSSDPAGKTFRISDAPNALPIKGQSFSLVPSTDEEEVSHWMAMRGKDPLFVPRKPELWRLYSRRSQLKLNIEQCQSLALFSLLSDVPTFFWLCQLSADQVFAVLSSAIVEKLGSEETERILLIGMVLGRGSHSRLVAKLGKERTRIDQKMLTFPKSSVRTLCEKFFHSRLVGRPKAKETEERFRRRIEDSLTALASEFGQGNRGVEKEMTAYAQDFELYSLKQGWKP